jgi:rare lipoprotein A (peptidoglycan hydrolase)
MQLHDARGKRLYLTAEERRTFLVAPAPLTCSMRTLRRVARRRAILALAFLGVLPSCAMLPVGWTGRQAGLASWYGPGFHGRRTASGTVYTGTALTAAHRSLPFGTLVRVTNLENGRQVVVVIDDRGPFIRGRIIDLSVAAARRLGMVRDGVAPVRIKVIRWAEEPEA